MRSQQQNFEQKQYERHGGENSEKKQAMSSTPHWSQWHSPCKIISIEKAAVFFLKEKKN